MVSTEKPESNQLSRFPKPALLVLLLYAIFWLVAIGDRALLIERLPTTLHWAVHGLGAVIVGCWLLWALKPVNRAPRRLCIVGSAAFVVWWQAAIFMADAIGWEIMRASVARWGTIGLFVLGLAWFVWWVDRAAQRIRQRTTEHAPGRQFSKHSFMSPVDARERLIWNPLDVDAWYYRRGAKKLNQSLSAFVVYSFCFLLVFLLLSQMQGCQEIYEMPSGGGEPKQIVQTIKVQKVIRKKFVVNPYSAILFQVPNIDETVNLNLSEITKHHYEIGYGQGEGAGFAGGTFRGKVRFIRLEYTGGDWNQDFGIGGDLNMLTEYGIRTKHKIENRTESRRIVQLSNFPAKKSPPTYPPA